MKIVTLIENTPGVAGCVAQHGLSFYVETLRHRVLFDAGPSEETVTNAMRLGIDLHAVDVAVLSHGHYDHSGGLAAFARCNPAAPIYMQACADGAHYAFDGIEKGCRFIGIDPMLANLPQVHRVSGDFTIDDELTLFTVDVLRNPLPSTNQRILKKVGGTYVADDFRHEQCLFVRSGATRVLLSGCAHCGILNILEAFRVKFGDANLPHVVMSGFHFMRKQGYDAADFAACEDVARRLLDYPCTFYTGHCTGLEPYARMKAVMGNRLHYAATGETVVPDAFVS